MKQCDCAEHGGCQKQLDVNCTSLMKVKAVELRNMVHQIAVSQVRDHVLMQAPTIRIDQRRRQRRQSRHCKTAKSTESGIFHLEQALEGLEPVAFGKAQELAHRVQGQ